MSNSNQLNEISIIQKKIRNLTHLLGYKSKNMTVNLPFYRGFRASSEQVLDAGHILSSLLKNINEISLSLQEKGISIFTSNNNLITFHLNGRIIDHSPETNTLYLAVKLENEE